MTAEQTDLRFEQELRSVIRALAPADAPVSLRAAVGAIPSRDPVRARRGWASPRLFQFAATVAIAVTVVVAAGLVFSLLNGPTGPIGVPSRSPSPEASPAPTTVQRVLEFQVVPPNRSATKDDVSAVIDVMEARLRLLSSSQSGAVTVGGDPDTVRLTYDFSSGDAQAPDRIAAVLSAPGNVRFVPLGPISDVEVGATIEPALTDVIDGNDVTSVAIDSTQTGQLALQIILSAAASDAFDAYASAHYQEQFAIVLDGRIVAAPIIQATRFDGQLQVSGSDDELRELGAVLSSGPLPFPVRLVSDS